MFAVVAGTAAVLAVSHSTTLAKEHQPKITVSSTPINRDASLGTSFAPIVKKVAPSVVNIYSTRFIKERLSQNPMFADPFFRQFFRGQLPPGASERERTRKEQSLGSGVIVSPDGYILTADHVVADADEVKVSLAGNKTEYTAKIIGKDRATDVAVLKIDANNLPAITLADSDKIEIGDVVLAIGNPFGIGQTVTKGIVSALGRSGLPGFNRYQDFIQTDAAINPGNSGGALVDTEGRLVGINTAIISPSGGNNGIGFAVPINMARNVLEKLISGGKVTRGYLGIIPQDIDEGLAQQFNLPSDNGALVGDVMSDTPAAKAGIKSGDVIVSVNGKAITDAHDLQLTISQMMPGTDAKLKIIRNGESRNVTVTLGELPGTVTSNTQSGSDNNGSMTDALDGVTVADINSQIRQQLQIPDDVKGAIITDVASDSNSSDAGLQANDIIVGINRHPVTSAEDAVKLCQAAKGDRILVKIWRRSGDFAGTRYLSVDNTKRTE